MEQKILKILGILISATGFVFAMFIFGIIGSLFTKCGDINDQGNNTSGDSEV